MAWNSNECDYDYNEVMYTYRNRITFVTFLSSSQSNVYVNRWNIDTGYDVISGDVGVHSKINDFELKTHMEITRDISGFSYNRYERQFQGKFGKGQDKLNIVVYTFTRLR